MQTFRLRHRDHTLLFSGQYRSFRECVEAALAQGICLSGASFDHADLSEVNFDGAVIEDASFNGTNLTGANISEAELRNCNFTEASLFNACFCHTNLQGSVFTNAGFGGTDMAGAQLDNCAFSGLSTFGLNLRACASLAGATYMAEWKRCPMSRVPIVIAGLGDTIVALLDDDVLIGPDLYTVRRAVWQAGNPLVALPEELISRDMHKLVFLLQRLKNETGEDSESFINQKLSQETVQ